MMVEHMHQSCANLVNASAALCGKGGSTLNVVIAEISAELQRERQRNAELMERILMLEAQLQGRDKAGCKNGRQEIRKFKRHKAMPDSKQVEEKNLGNSLVKWVSTDETQFARFERPKSSKFELDSNDKDDTDDQEDGEYREEINVQFPSLESSLSNHLRITSGNGNQKQKEDVKDISTDNNTSQMRSEENYRKEMTMEGHCETPLVQRRHQKIAFCPKEVKRILDSDELSRKNAQSHTIRKIIVFSSLGIRHGCEDMYELDLNHFSILHKGETYTDQKNPGEHVLYDNPGVRRKIFYPNPQNPTLCPVQILKDEKTMRPSDASCPSCLFLCIKYGGRTRNLPQNEYVRQRMGRNKLKSFGPLICRMAMLAHFRCGSFFFKALGITLLFMAGFPNDLVQRETKYRNLDLLQKYYRTDKDAEGEDLFLSNPVTNDSSAGQKTIQTTASSKQKRKRHKTTSANLNEKTSSVKSPPHSGPPDQLGLMGNASNLTNGTISNTVINNPSSNVSLQTLNQSSFVLPAYPTNSFVPMLYWHPAHPFQPCPYPSTYTYPPPGNYLSIQPHPYYSHPRVPDLTGNGRNDAASEIAERGSNSCSNSKESRKKMS